MEKGIIYKYTFPNGKIYIGQTIDLDKRHKQHLYYAKHAKGKRALCDIVIAKYGEPKLEVIEEVVEDSPSKFKKMLNEAETKWIKEYDATNKEIGYNIQQGGHTANEETYILEEIYGEKIQGQAEKIFYVRGILDSIIIKVEKRKYKSEKKCMGDSETFNLKKYNLTTEEEDVWFNLKFNYGYETTFDKLIRAWLDDDFCSGGDGELYVEDFKNSVDEMFDYFISDMCEKTWKYVNENKEKLIEDFFENKF